MKSYYFLSRDNCKHLFDVNFQEFFFNDDQFSFVVIYPSRFFLHRKNLSYARKLGGNELIKVLHGIVLSVP